MGLFSKRQEDPVEWAGLPSEPDRPESAAERLAAAAPVDAGGIADLGLGGGGAVESIVIPVTRSAEVAESQGSDEDE
jgi:hypothetical protein